jgi:methionyl-tRNA synthetase
MLQSISTTKTKQSLLNQKLKTIMSHSKARKILVTNALPYANGLMHLGHMVEHIQTDIWVRFQKMMGNECYAVCGDDTHGTAIMLNAEQRGITPEALIEEVHQERLASLSAFSVNYDNYYTTHSEENKHFASLIYERSKAAGAIEVKTIKQLFDPEKNLFLADRYVKGECPKCGAADQYGDNCEVCSATYNANELKNPYSALSGAKPIEKDSEHYFFKQSNYVDMLKAWTRSGVLQEEIANKLDEWLESGLQDKDISRDAPYFGFEIPGTTGKYFYVWMDAPIGYISIFKNLCDNSPNNKELDFNSYWLNDSKGNNDTELYHFIGKDIIQFHALLWPAMLSAADFRLPNGIYAHGFLTVNGEKLSKSRGTAINAQLFIKHLNPEALRFYFACKLNNRVEDIDLNMEDFVQRFNSDVIGKVVNIASRCAGFIVKKHDGLLSENNIAPDLLNELQGASSTIAQLYENREFSKAIREIMALADKANQFIDEHKPWILAKEQGKEQKVQDVCSVGINCFRLLSLYLKPVMPLLAEKSEAFLNIEPLSWQDSASLLNGHKINKFKALMNRLESEKVEAMMNEAKESAEKATANSANKSDIKSPQTTDNEKTQSKEIQFDDFAKVDLRVAEIVNAEHVVGADKLLKLTLNLGDQQKQVFAGIKSAYQPEQLIGRLTVMVANLAPRKMRFGVSEGMVLAAGPGGDEIFLLTPDNGAKPGMEIK